MGMTYVPGALRNELNETLVQPVDKPKRTAPSRTTISLDSRFLLRQPKGLSSSTAQAIARMFLDELVKLA